jgi:acyl carrier protein
MTDDEHKVIAALQTLLGEELDIATSTMLRDGLGLDSNALVELTVLIHNSYHVDLGRRAAERKVIPETVADVAALMGTR